MNTAALGSWRKPPLAYVVAELAISPYYSMGGAVPELQDKLRSSFPRTIEGQEIIVDGAKPIQQPIWRLMSADQSHGIQLGTRALSLHATSYSNSADFLARWEEVLHAVESLELGAFVERAGLRYIDLIVPDDGISPAAYLEPHLQGLSLEGGISTGSMWGGAFQFGAQTSVNLRIGAPSPTGLLLPPEFNTLPLQKPEILVAAEDCLKRERPIGFIDTDCATIIQRVFNAPDLLHIYAEMQKLTSKTFQAALSPIAKQEWK